MKRRLTGKEMLLVSSMLFGMFFGAGNLIFPAALGAAAGQNIVFAFPGMFITAVGLPLLAVAALGISRSDSVLVMARRAGKHFGIVFSAMLYLTIGPLFAVPRCAGTSFSIAAVALDHRIDPSAALAVFSLAFFLAVLLLSLSPGKLMIRIGKILNPIFLVLLFCLMAAALIHPVSSLSMVLPAEGYLAPGSAFANGFLEGYNTLDALAGLAFGIVIVSTIRNAGVEEPVCIASESVRSGVFSCLFMGIIYFLLSLVTASSASLCGSCTNGSEILGVVARHYFGNAGTWLLFAIVTMACLKTAIGLVTSCAEAFVQMFPHGPAYKTWTIIFVILSTGLANMGLTSIVAYCIPVLMLLYPPAIVLIVLSLFGRFFHNERRVFIAAMSATLTTALLDFFRALIPFLNSASAFGQALALVDAAAGRWLPLYEAGLGWVLPAVIGFAVGLILCRIKPKNA